MLSHVQCQEFDRNGFVLVKDFFSPEEINILLSHVTESGRIKEHARNMPDASGKSSKLAIWSTLGDDVFALVSRSQRVVNGARILLREEVYHWHSKVMLKEAKIGGAWEWHQDYGYWYNDGCLYPNMISCMIALDAANKENGCLKVIPGSHLLGRINHAKTGNQSGADLDRVAEAERRLGVHYCEAPAGSALFFHGNTLHASDANLSDRHRRAYICTYNAMSNIPFGERGHGKPEPIPVVPDNAILEAGKALRH